jgi:hypothetical protein
MASVTKTFLVVGEVLRQLVYNKLTRAGKLRKKGKTFSDTL